MKMKPKILLVDDETDILHILSFLLKREGFDVETASSGLEGLNKILAQKFDGVITDLSMPGMDGLTLLKQVRAHHSYMPFIFLSGHARAEDEHEMINYGAYELIVKPHVERVPEALQTLLKAGKEIEILKEAGEEGAELFLDLVHSAEKKAI
jgi:two-component system OmpR family response regulator